MSFYLPRAFVAQHQPSSAPSFTDLFRLLDSADQCSPTPTRRHHQRSNMKAPSFSPKFDVQEVGELYELQGELPGLKQSDVEIEFTDDQTLTIKGRIERSYSRGNQSTTSVESSTASSTESAETTPETASIRSQQPTVEDEDTPAGTPIATPTTTSSEAAKVEEKKLQGPVAKFWVSERSVGEFSRSFTFPVRIDQGEVKASMKNGILNVVVPKAKKLETRKIPIA